MEYKRTIEDKLKKSLLYVVETLNRHKFTLLNLPYCFAGKLQEYVKALMEER